MKLNLLVIDDSPVIRAMIIKTIKLSGRDDIVFYQAGNGKEGLDILENNWIDIVLLDINMPVMDGEELLNIMRNNSAFKDIPVIIISTETSKTRIDLLEKKANGFIHKPFTPEAIASKIYELTEAKYATNN